MNKYENGKIYKLSGSNGLVYYGSTIQPLKRRLLVHKSKSNTCISKLICDMKIELLENYPCNCKRELEIRERWFIENNECINSNIPFTTKEEKEQYKKQYYIDNQKKYLEKQKQYSINNKEQIKQIKKQYRINNKEQIKQNRINNKEKRKQYNAYISSFIGILARGFF